MLFYHYVSVPCVYLSYFANAKTVRKVRPTHTQYNSAATGPSADKISQYCANPLVPSGGSLCCVASGSRSNDAGVGGSNLRGVDIASCKYKWETVKYATMEARCSALGRQPCDAYIEGGITSFSGELCGINYTSSSNPNGQRCLGEAPICYDSYPGNWGKCYTADANWAQRTQYRAQTCSYVTQSTSTSQVYSWTTQPCTLQAQVSNTGQVFVVHEADNLLDQYSRTSGKTVAISVPWVGGPQTYPKVGSTCAATAGCAEQGDTCLCNVTEVTTAVFTDGANLPTLDQVYQQLHTGHPDIVLFDAGTYTKCTTPACNARTDVEVYLLAANGAAFDATTVFKIMKHTRILFLANKNSKTVLGGGAFSFRSPVKFMETPTATLFEAEYEMTAYLDHLFYQPELPPFLCYRLIQRLVTSNPSPRYIRSVVEAFKTGTHDGVTYSGKYGDLKATIYAILLDVEARSFVLEGDPIAGRIREPILKLLHVYRSLNFIKQAGNRAIDFHYLQESIGQQFGYAPSVFGFYQPTYSPDGPINNAGVVAPESQLGTTPFHIGFMNGMCGLIQNGMTRFNKGFGTWSSNQYQANYGPGTLWSDNQGALAFAPNGSATSDVIAELDILLTRGRLNSHAKGVIQAAYDAKKDTNPQQALRDAQMLFTNTQEFHATNLVRLSSQLRVTPPPQVSQGRPYKAIVYIFQNGGADSYNMIMPHTCNSVDLYAQYEAVRTPDNYPKNQMRTITTTSPNPCSVYGLNTRMELLETLFETSTASEGGATILLNAGAMVEPLTKAEYKAKTKRTPPGLFGHFEMQKNGQNLHAQDTASKGILGRVTSALSKQASAFKTEMYSLSGNAKAVEGGASAPNIISATSEQGVTRYQYYDTMASKVADIYSNYTAQSVFAENHAIQIDTALKRTELLGSIMGSTTTTATFPTQNAIDPDYRNDVSMQLKQVAKIIKLRGNLETERDVFFVEQHGWDTHFDMQAGTEKRYSDLDLGLKAFHSEMKTQGIWDDVVVITGPDLSLLLLICYCSTLFWSLSGHCY